MTGITIERRALVKTVTWRFLATIGTIVIALLFTRSIELSIGIGTVEVILKTILYYLHERVWDRAGSVTVLES